MAKDLKTFEGAAAYSRDPRSDLFLLATTNFFGEDTFYEKANARNDRFIGLVHRVAKDDPAWLGEFLPWLRRDANIRTAAVVGAVEGARILARAGVAGSAVGPARKLVAETLSRADEPAEALAYYLSTYGRRIPKPIQRGIADAARRLYTERNFIKWDSSTAAVRMADVIELTHVKPVDASKFDHPNRRQSALFKYIVDSRHRPTQVPDGLNMLKSREMLLADTGKLDKLASFADDPEYVTGMLQSAGMTWEQVSSWGAFTNKTWEALIPTMGYMALLRNLRNFQDKGVSDAMLKMVAMTIGDQEMVRNSKQLPYRFLSAYLEATHPVWALALETAMQYSTANLPSLPGRTLVLVDTSGSMQSPISAKSKITAVKAGALFGVALAAKGEDVDLYGFADGVFQFPVRKGAGVLRTVEAFDGMVGRAGHGTRTELAVRSTYAGHDRIVIVTDGQTFGTWHSDVSGSAPMSVPIYAFNTVGYAPAMMETSSTRHELGGLTDHTFGMIPIVEAGQQARWPWEEER